MERSARKDSLAVDRTDSVKLTRSIPAPRRILDPRQWALGTRLVASGLVLLAIVTVLTLASYRRAVDQRRRAEVDNALVITRTMSGTVEAFVRDVEATVQSLARVLGEQAAPLSQVQAGPYLRAVFQEQGVLRTLFVTNPSGRVIASYSGREIGLDLSSRPYVKELQTGVSSVWSGRLAGTQSGQITVAYGSAIRRPTSGQAAPGARNTLGFLVTAFYPAAVFQNLPFTLPEDARITLLDDRGALLFANHPDALRGRTDFSAVSDIRRALAGEVVVLNTRRGAVTGEARFGAIVPVPRTGWVLSFTRPLAPLDMQLRDEFFRQVGGLAIVFVLAALALVLFVNRILQPVTALSQASAAIARGERPHMPAPSGPPEVRRLAEGMAAMSQAVAERESALQRAEADQRFLAEASTALATSLDDEATLRQAARLAIPRIADWCAVHMVDEDGALRRVEVAHTDASREESVKEFARRYPPDQTDARSPTAHAIRTGQTVFLREISEEWLRTVGADEEAIAFVRDLGLRSLLVIPLRARGNSVGAITLVTADSGRVFDDHDADLATEFARRVAVAVDNARLYARERTIAQTLQRAALPRELPAMPGIAVQSAYVAGALGTDVGGDWYDAFWLPDGRIAVSVGDVAGRGLPAAVAMGQIRHGLRMAAFDDSHPSIVLSRVDRLIGSTLPDEMVTAIFGVIDPTAHTFTYSNAGHPPPILGAAEDRVDLLEDRGPPLGFMRTRDRGEAVVHLASGGFIVLYTDGLTELHRDPLRGQDALLNAVREELRLPSADRAAAVLRRVLGDAGPRDDIALLSVSLAREPVSRFDLTLPAIPSALPLVRQSVRRIGQLVGLSADRTAELEIAMGEAVNNVIEHAYGVVPGTVRVRGGIEDGQLVITVEDSGTWRPAEPSHTGRGLLIMRALVDEVRIGTEPTGTVVRLVVRLPLTRELDAGREPELV